MTNNARERLRSHIDTEGLRLTWVAEQLDIGREHLHRILKGERLPSMLLACKIERFTDHKIRLQDWAGELEAASDA